MLEFTLLKKDTSGLSHARRGRLKLNHGIIETPIFMPVGTYGSVKAMDADRAEGSRLPDHPGQYLPPVAAPGHRT